MSLASGTLRSLRVGLLHARTSGLGQRRAWVLSLLYGGGSAVLPTRPVALPRRRLVRAHREMLSEAGLGGAVDPGGLALVEPLSLGVPGASKRSTALAISCQKMCSRNPTRKATASNTAEPDAWAFGAAPAALNNPKTIR